MIHAEERILALADEQTKIIPGHGPLADLEETWGGGLFSGDRWIELVYAGVY